jgi:hypothetical protein
MYTTYSLLNSYASQHILKHVYNIFPAQLICVTNKHVYNIYTFPAHLVGLYGFGSANLIPGTCKFNLTNTVNDSTDCETGDLYGSA